MECKRTQNCGWVSMSPTLLEVCFSDHTRYNVTLKNGKMEYYNDIKLPDHNPAALMALVGIMEKYFVGDKVQLEIWDGLTHLL